MAPKKAAKKATRRAKPAAKKASGDWQGETLARVRALILQADPEVVEEVKWRKPSNPAGVPVWSHDGILCTGETYKTHVKLTFPKGSALSDPARLFNANLEGVRRAIDLHEGDKLDAAAFKALIREAAALNASTRKRPARAAKAPAAKPTLLAGGNPQIPKGDGDAPVQAYIAAMPGWKRDVGRRLDALITRTVPGVRKAVKWNSPFYGSGDEGWFLNYHCFTNYVKVAFFRGAALRPTPPGESKHKDVRYVDVHEDDLDEAQMAAWVRQAAALPGWVP